MAKYEFVVVGAGNAGLSAALQLALAGKKTLLIEQHNLPGGCATSFKRGRFEIEPSLHELCGIETDDNPGSIRKIFNEYGIDVEWFKVDDCFRVVSKYSDGTDMDVTLPSGRENFSAAMEKYVPGSTQRMNDFFNLCDEMQEAVGYFSNNNSYKLSTLIFKYGNALRTGAYPTSRVFKSLKLPQKCQDILSTYWSYLGVDLDHLEFLHYAMMVSSYIYEGAYIPAHTSHEISVKLIERFRELGGEVWMNCRAEEFIFNGKTVCGVRTNLGVIDCNYVLANINPDIIYGKMLPPHMVPEYEKKKSTARNKQYGGRMLTAYFCLNKSPEEIGIKDYCIFLPEHSDSVKEYENIMKGYDHNNYSIFLCYNVANPDFSPEGTCVCSFTTFGTPSEWNNITKDEYYSLKNKYAEKFLNSLKEKTGIDIKPYIEEMSVASPLTFARYLNTPEGSVYGYETRDWDSLMARMMMIDDDYPIKHLRPIGASGPRGDGYSSTYICGQMMAGLALNEVKKERGRR